MVNVNIHIPDDLHKKLKLEAVRQDKTLKKVIVDVLGGKK